MATAIVQKFKVGDIAKQMNTSVEKVVQAVIKTMEYVGENCVRVARQQGNYNDITGNLRSSIGYVVLRAGKIVKRSTPSAYSGPKGDGSQGQKEGEEFLAKLVGDYPTGVVLIVVAGMNYAVYVEAIHGRDVLTSAQLKAEQLVPELLAKIGIKK